MKCDELEAIKADTHGAIEWVYPKDEVDAAIADLKSRIHELESIPHTDNSAVIEKLVQENERLIKCCKEYDSRQRIDERIKFNGAQQLRATKRALWLARAWGANQRTKYLDLFLTGRAHAIRKYKWIKITSKCRAKAEEYK